MQMHHGSRPPTLLLIRNLANPKLNQVPLAQLGGFPVPKYVLSVSEVVLACSLATSLPAKSEEFKARINPIANSTDERFRCLQRSGGASSEEMGIAGLFSLTTHLSIPMACKTPIGLNAVSLVVSTDSTQIDINVLGAPHSVFPK
jgi:hypothetical protein